jgi:hypothetical protein
MMNWADARITKGSHLRTNRPYAVQHLAAAPNRDYYERRGGRWQVLWSHVTEIVSARQAA